MTSIDFLLSYAFCQVKIYNCRAEVLASEIRDLQGELGDYNTVSITILF